MSPPFWKPDAPGQLGRMPIGDSTPIPRYIAILRMTTIQAKIPNHLAELANAASDKEQASLACIVFISTAFSDQ